MSMGRKKIPAMALFWQWKKEHPNKEQRLLLKAGKTSHRRTPFHHVLSNCMFHFTLFGHVTHLFPLGDDTLTRVSGGKSSWPMIQTFLWLYVLCVCSVTWEGHKEEL